MRPDEPGARRLLQEPPADVADALRDERARFGPYARLGLLGRGGFGTVWLAWDPRLGRRVALKILQGDDPEEIARFMREARTAAALSHPNIAAVYEVGRQDRDHFIAMQYVPGETLARQRLSPREALEAIRDAAGALAYAHAQGVIHRDLKPQNLMRGEDGRVVVLDFGLARATQPGSSLTLSGEILGTPAYMSPEQARGRRATERSDVYGLGAVLYELLTGQTPFAGAHSLDVLRRVLEQEPIPPRRLNPRLDADVETVVLKAMEKDPDRRYASAEALGAEITRLLSGEAILAHPPSLWYRMRKRVRRRPAVWTLGSLLAATLAAGGALAIWRAHAHLRDLEELRELDDRLQQARTRIRQANDLEAEADFNAAVWSQHLSRAEQLCAEAAARRPSYPSAWYEWGAALSARRDWDGAQAKLDEAVRVDPTFVPARIARAQLLAERIFASEDAVRGTPEVLRGHEVDWVRSALDDLAVVARHGVPEDQSRQIALLQHYLRRDWAAFDRTIQTLRSENLIDWRIRRLEAESLHRRRRHRQAVERYAQILQVRPGAAWLWCRQAHLWLDAEEWSRAQEAADRALSLDPSIAEAYAHRGLSHLAREAHRHALEDFDRALALRPSMAEVYPNRGLAREALGDAAGALQDYETALALNPTLSEAYDCRATLRARSGDPKGALPDYDRAVGLNPTSFKLIHNRSVARWSSGDPRGAVEDATRIIALKPDFEPAYVTRAVCRTQLNDPAGALEDFSRLLQFQPANVEYRFGRAERYLALDRPADALADLEQALKAAPKDGRIIFARGEARRRLGRYRDAIDDFNRALELGNVDAAEVRAMLDQAQEALGRREESP